MNILITGGYGFIGSHYIRYVLGSDPNINVVNLDNLSYASNSENLLDGLTMGYEFVYGDINEEELVEALLSQYKIDQVINFAAESHVDRSISESKPFIHSNIDGLATLLEAFREYCKKAPDHSGKRKFIQISTDEVYGDGDDYPGAADEQTRLNPSSPYAASKAAADLLVQSYHRTYGLPTVITRSSNNYGPNQHQEKFIPTVIKHALKDEEIPIYGDGAQMRDWLYVADNCRAIDAVRKYGQSGEVYNVASGHQLSNEALATKILQILDKPQILLTHIDDRPGHDRSYLVDDSKVRALGWQPEVIFDEGLRDTVAWYQQNPYYLK